MPHAYEVSVHNTFDAADPADAVRQMIEWLIDNDAHRMSYRVQREDESTFEFIDAEDI